MCLPHKTFGFGTDGAMTDYMIYPKNARIYKVTFFQAYKFILILKREKLYFKAYGIVTERCKENLF